MKVTFKDYTYTVNNIPGFNFDTALRLWRAKFETVKHFKRDVITHPALEELGQFVEEVWDDIQPVTVAEALQLQNMEQRRLYFDCIGVAQLFKSLEPKLLDKQVLKKDRKRWTDENEEWFHHFEDTYELYEIDGNKLFGDLPDATRWRTPEPVYAVRCWCTTTGREYWIYVPREAALGSRWVSEKDNPDAIRAIAWTIRLNISNPKRIFRQGDIIVAEESEESKPVWQYHLTKDQYLKLVCSET